MSESNTPEPRFEDVVGRLEHVVQQLEGGELSLDAALALYQEGVTLARAGHQLLEGAERRVEELQKMLAEPTR